MIRIYGAIFFTFPIFFRPSQCNYGTFFCLFQGGIACCPPWFSDAVYCMLFYFQMINGYLRSQGILVPRQKNRSMLRTADPVGTASRWGRTVARRTYFVPTPNSLWHIDGHMKLIRFVSILLYGRAGNNLSSITSHLAIQTGQNATQMEHL